MIRAHRLSLCLLLVTLPLTGCSHGTITASPTPSTSSTPAATSAPSVALASPTAISTATAVPLASLPPTATATQMPSAASGRIEATGALTVVRAAHTATLLPGGKVLIAGGCTRGTCDLTDEGRTAELYDPATGTFARTGALTVERDGHQAVALADGRILLVGGWSHAGLLASAEVYDPATGTFAATGAMSTGRGGHTATLLADGWVLVAGGMDGPRAVASAEPYDPRSGQFSPTGNLLTARGRHVAVRLADGRVLIIGGSGGRGSVLASAEVYDPAIGTLRSDRRPDRAPLQARRDAAARRERPGRRRVGQPRLPGAVRQCGTLRPGDRAVRAGRGDVARAVQAGRFPGLAAERRCPRRGWRRASGDL